MNEISPSSARRQSEPALTIAISATFTADPIVETIAFWMAELGFAASIEIAPYNQVFQQLLDPSSLLALNARGANVVLVRPEDWLRALPAVSQEKEVTIRECLEQNAAELIGAVRSIASRTTTPLIVVLCPSTPTQSFSLRRELLATTAAQIESGLTGTPGLSLAAARELALYPVADGHDLRRDHLGHIPYTAEMFAALGTVVARQIHARLATPHKVVVLDCDNTLWKGAVGEDGVDGIDIPPGFQALQRFMLSMIERGFILCLCSKNIESDVFEVFEQRSDMLLRREHFVSWRINWEPKSQNLRSLARELNLNLDSFIFLDDNPLECAEVSLACPEVLALALPDENEIERFLYHVWVFDKPSITAEDRQRTAMYRQEAERARLQREFRSVADFLASLELKILVEELSQDQIERVAELTQRTNQFNFTTTRRNEREIRGLRESGLECRVVTVTDRFGDYGLVGVLIYCQRAHAVEIDTFLLSCRVLGRGVEHRMLAAVGSFALAQAVPRVVAVVNFTKKNQPARDFLSAVGSAYARAIEGGICYEFPAEVAAAISYSPDARPADQSASGADGPDGSSDNIAAHPKINITRSKSSLYENITREWSRPERVLVAVRGRLSRQPLPVGVPGLVPPSDAVQAGLVEIWTEVLGVEGIGARDDFFELGGTSLHSVELIACIERRFGVDLPLSTVLESPTVEALAQQLRGAAVRQ